MTEQTKKLGVPALAALVISAMIGGGIFSMPQNIAQGASVMAVIAAWVISGCGIYFLASTFRILSEVRPDEKLNAAFETLPVPALTPRQAYMQMVRGKTEMVPAEKLAGRIAANAVIPYPPGIPMVISGERFGDAGNPHIAYLESLSAWDKEFPGFEHVTEGSSVINGIYHVPCITE